MDGHVQHGGSQKKHNEPCILFVLVWSSPGMMGCWPMSGQKFAEPFRSEGGDKGQIHKV